MSFRIISDMKPAGDQPRAIDQLVDGISRGHKKQTLLGITGSGKTFTVANVIEKTQLPTLIISHNKTLAGQLYQEFKELFPENKVSYFVSYYDYYQPESYLPSSDTYIAKEVEINDLIDKLRLEATSNLFSGPDNIVVASVSCIYNIGDPIEFSGRTIELKIDRQYDRRQLFESLVSLYYQRSEMDFKRSTFRVRGETVEIWPSYQDWIIVAEFDNGRLVKLTERHPLTSQEIVKESFTLYPAKQYVGGAGNDKEKIFSKIRNDCQGQIKLFESQGKILEANRIKQRVEYDLEMLEEMGYVNGIENYSIYFDKNRSPGDPPYTLVDYFCHLWGDNFLTIIDESHVTVPQIGGMYHGDRSRKQTLIDYGFRLPSALDNRPLKFDEFYGRVSNLVYVSATPGQFELDETQKSYNQVKSLLSYDRQKSGIVEQIIRPTGLVDPPISIRPEKGQISDLLEEIKKRIAKKERVLVITLTKRMSEDLSVYLSDPAKTGFPIKVAYLHSDIDTLERSEILDKLRMGDYDVLVGINLLREGIDLPEVSLVAILDAGQQGFLRSRSSLIQIMGRASRNVGGEVILYSDVVSNAMQQAIIEVNRRRQIQLKYNQDHGITPETIKKSIRPKIIQVEKTKEKHLPGDLVTMDPLSLTPPQRKKLIVDLRKLMRQSAADMNFEEAIRIRDRIKEIEIV